jgi:hypothetical protein
MSVKWITSSCSVIANRERRRERGVEWQDDGSREKNETGGEGEQRFWIADKPLVHRTELPTSPFLDNFRLADKSEGDLSKAAL